MRAWPASFTWPAGSLLLLTASCALVGSRQPAVPDDPLSRLVSETWLFPIATGSSGGSSAGGSTDSVLRVPGSSVTYTRRQIRDLFNVPDWRPAEHPPMPEVVARGRRPSLYACGYCHLPNGQGRPENAALAGLPAQFIVQQMEAFRNGSRVSSRPDFRPAELMRTAALEATDEEIAAAAAYFASIPFRLWTTVVESATVPRTRVAGGMLVPANGGTEPIGERIVEVPADLERTELRDGGSGFLAFVPPGSIGAGRVLVTNGGGRTVPCARCHGPGLRGLGDVPPLAGRSPSYLVRQLVAYQGGARRGLITEPMLPVVAGLNVADAIAIAAYIAYLPP